ncbi:dehydrogenase [Pseudoscourfieldia marina]
MSVLTVLVTGASRGLGLELCRQHAQRGHKVFACCRTPADAHALNQLHLDVLPLDVTSDESATALAAKLDETHVALDILYNNAGVALNRKANMEDVNTDLWAECLNTNVLGPARVLKACIPALRRAENGKFKVVNISSSLGSIGRLADGVPVDLPATDVVYRSSKAALNMSTACTAVDLRKTDPNAVVVAVHPGWVDTDMGSRRGNNDGLPEVKPPLNVEESISGVIATVMAATTKESGTFLDFAGGADLVRVPW